MAASSQIGNIDQEFFPYSIDYIKLLILKLFWVQQGWAQEDIQKQLCPVMIFNPNQSLGNRAMMIMMYYWRFWEPCANVMLVVLLPKLWFGLKIMTGHNCFWMSSWGSPLLDPKKLQNQQVYRIDWIKKTPGRCCQSGYLLPWWLWCTIEGFGNPGQMLC